MVYLLLHQGRVAPRWGAGIEIFSTLPNLNIAFVAPRWGAGIEIINSAYE